MKELSKWLLQIQEVQTPISGHMTELTLERHFDEILPGDSEIKENYYVKCVITHILN